MRRIVLAAAAVLFLTAAPFFSLVRTERAPAAHAQDAAKVDGAASFRTNCAFCHGNEGKGDGPAAYLIFPKPRDFTRGLFKIRSTHQGELPTDDDLFRVISEGMPGSAMLAWKWMPEAERRALVDEVKRLAVGVDDDDQPFKWFEKRTKGTPVEVPEEPPVTEQTIALGKKVYFRLECQKCHGGEGKGDGPSAVGLKDDWGNPISPRDFTSGLFKGGSTDRDLFLRTVAGIEGTPMPAFTRDSVSDAERWALVQFVRSLTTRPTDEPAVQAISQDLQAKKVDALPTTPEDGRWDAIPVSRIPLIQLFQKGKAPSHVDVRVAHDGKTIAFLLDWADASQNVEVLRVQDFRDGAAIQFGVKGPTTPLMGAKGMPVNIWHWKADWQADLGAFQDVEKAYPRMQMDMYPQTKGDQTVSHRQAPPSAVSTELPFVTAKAVGNPGAQQRRRSPVEDLNAVGFGTLTPQPEAQQNVQGSGLWIGGHWRVVFTRAMASPDADDAPFESGTRPTLSFAVWDGSLRDRDGQKSVTTWYRLRIE